MGSSDSSLRFRACEVSQVPDRTLDTRPPALPRPLRAPYVVCRRTMMASSNRKDWPADCDLHEALTHGSLALELMPSSDKTPARQSPSARLILLLTLRHLYEISSFQLTSSAKLILAYPNLGSIIENQMESQSAMSCAMPTLDSCFETPRGWGSRYHFAAAQSTTALISHSNPNNRTIPTRGWHARRQA